jgi:TonB-linked SusC/RagA family outer membrane protein
MGEYFRRLLRPAIAALACLALSAAPAVAQDTGSIRGRVVEAATGRPLGGAQVSVPAIQRGSVANAAGEFLLVGMPAGTHRLRAEMIGYGAVEQEVTVGAGQVASVEFRLELTAISIDEIVVTGTAGAVSKRTIGNSIARVDAADVTAKTAISTLTELLQARTPGLTLLPNSGVTGTASEIRIRGASSLINNAPVVYIDGVRYHDGGLGTFTPSGAGATSYTGQTTSALSGLNPSDIESIEVIKGPAAATLYGAEAAAGVIQIITKKGRSGQQALQWTARVEYGHNDWALDIPDNYTVCTTAKLADPATWPGCQGKPAGTVLRGNPLRDDPDALRTGLVRKQSLSLRGGGDRYSFYVAGENVDEEGVFHNNYDERRSVRANFTFQPTDVLDFAITSNYIRGMLRLPVGDEAAQGMLLSAFRGRPGRIPPGNNPRSDGWATTNPLQANAYDNTTKSDRLTLGATANFNPLPWFRNRLTVGLDYTSSLAQILSLPGSADADYAGTPEGFVAQRVPRNYIYTVDYVGNVVKNLTPDLGATTSFGMQYNYKHLETLYASGRGLGAPTVTQIDRAQITSGANSYSDSKALGFFAQEQLAWKNRLFVTGALRMDNSSVFGDEIRRILYPKASVSYVLSEEPALSGFFDQARIGNFRLRGAWGQAGQAPPPYVASQTYTVSQVVLGPNVGSELRTLAYGNANLKPERGSEIELGFDLGAFNDRVGVEFTYYNKRMNDVLVTQAVPASTGWVSSPYVNLGETKNSGVELVVDASLIQTPKLAWDIGLSLSTNSNELVSFGDTTLKSIAISGASYTPGYQQHRPGYPLAGWWLQVPQRNADGTPVMNGATVVLTDTAVYLGSAVPTREISLSSTFTLFRDLQIFALFDYKGGHKVFNYKEYNRCRFQDNCERMADPRNIDLETGAVVNPEVNVWRQVPSAYLEDGSFIKLRDLSVTYSLPTEWAARLRANAASVTLAGHNLALWSDYSGIDPEVNGYGNRSFVRADVYAVPMIRRMTMSVNLSF